MSTVVRAAPAIGQAALAMGLLAGGRTFVNTKRFERLAASKIQVPW